MRLKIVQAIAVVLTGLALVPAGAHLFELPNKIGLPQDALMSAVKAFWRATSPAFNGGSIEAA